MGARGSSRSSEEHELLDGDLCAKVFQTITWIELRQSQPSGGDSATLQRLELALLYVFQYFRKAYIGEQSNVSSTNLYSRLAERVGIADQVTVMDVIMNKVMPRHLMHSSLRSLSMPAQPDLPPVLRSMSHLRVL